jgi:Acyclic terpene utilisation family protein AtuA
VSSPYRVAGAGGFWGDRDDALSSQVREGPVDAVMLDYLAEVTMSILRRQRQRDANAGWARDFLAALEPALDVVVERGIRVVTNAGGMNPKACGRAVVELARRAGHRGVAVGVVSGDDLCDRVDELMARGVSFENLDTGRPLAEVRERVESANAYLGAAPIAEAMRRGAQIVITGRTTDSALALGPLLAHFDWGDEDWDRRAAGVVAGHLLECGAQASGGNFAGGWPDVPRLADIGYPIAEVERDGTFVLTKHPTLGGRVDPAVVTEQLLYEIGDPRRYLTPDTVADFTSIRLEDLGSDRVRVSGVSGHPPPSELKVSIGVSGGFRSAALLTFVWPDAILRAQATAELLLARLAKLGVQIEAHHVDLIGVSGAHGPMAPELGPGCEPNEVMLRLAVRTKDRANALRFAREIAPLMLAGVPGAASGPTFGGRPEPQPIVDFWPALVPASEVVPEVEVLES